jgi:hypothetical protein
MARQFLTSIDLAKNELQNARIQNLASAPATPVLGQIYYNTTDNKFYWWNGTVWVAAEGGTVAYGSVTPETVFGQASSNGSATTLARSDHTHGTPSHTAADHTSIPLSTFPVTGSINAGGFPIVGVGAPVAPTDAANKAYVDNAIAGLSWKDPVLVASTSAVTLNGVQTVDGISLVEGDRVLVKNQSPSAGNGIYVVHAGAAPWTRAEDANIASELEAAAVFVQGGVTQSDTAWVMTTNAPIVMETTGLFWSQFAGGAAVTAGAGMTQSGNTLNVVAGDTTLTVAADDIRVNTAVIATVAGTVPPARSITAGAGLTGGGDLSANRTIDIVGDATMVITADAIGQAPLTGDVTTAAGANAATIAADAVTNAKLANMPANTVKGNNTAGVADPVDLTIAQLTGMLGIPTVRKHQTTNAAALATTVTHNFGTTNVFVTVFRNSAPGDEIECDIEHTDANTVTVRFATVPVVSSFVIALMAVL